MQVRLLPNAQNNHPCETMKDTDAMSTLDTAIQAINADLSIVPILPATSAGDKRPAIKWRNGYIRLTEHDAATWFTDDAHGLAVIMGSPSRDLLMIELEGRAASELGTLSALAKNTGISDLWHKLFAWCETSPSGGWHFYLHAPGNTSGNRKLARNTHGDVIAETRENGGYSVIAPTTGRFHHNGKPWTIVHGGPSTAATVTLDELDTLLALFRTLDHTPPPPQPVHSERERTEYDGITPGDDFEAKTSWADILQPHGWAMVGTRGRETFWRRPGKNTGISASTGHADDRDRLYVWTTSTEFNSETPYTKYGAYALLNHAGNYHQAAKTLAAAGYGTPAEHPIPSHAERSLDRYINQLVSRAGSELTPSTPSGITTPTSSSEPTVYTRTDDGNALRFAHTYTGKYRYVPEKKEWAVWNGYKWDLDNGEAAVIQDARVLMRALPIKKDAKGKPNKLDVTHRQKSLQAGAISAMLKLARNSDGIFTPLNQFDSEPYLLNTPAGIFDLRQGIQLRPDPRILCLRSTTVAPDWTQATPHWNKFLDETFLSDTDLITYIHRFFGVVLIGEVTEQILPFFYGTGANGKTTMLNVIQRILGTGKEGYSTTTPSEILTNGDRHPADVAALHGVRLSVISELEEGSRIAEAKAKLLTGSDTITARFMGENWFTFTPSHTFITLTNTMLETASGGSRAFWRRVRNIPFNYVVPKEDRNPQLENKLLEEAPGILAWMINGTRDYLANGLPAPDAVQAATDAYEASQDTVGQFIEEACKIHETNQELFQIRVSLFRDQYERWCSLNLVKPIGSKSLTQRLAKLGIRTKKGAKGSRYYSGISINDDFLNSMEGALA